MFALLYWVIKFGCGPAGVPYTGKAQLLTCISKFPSTGSYRKNIVLHTPLHTNCNLSYFSKFVSTLQYIYWRKNHEILMHSPSLAVDKGIHLHRNIQSSTSLAESTIPEATYGTKMQKYHLNISKMQRDNWEPDNCVSTFTIALSASKLRNGNSKKQKGKPMPKK